ncbi:MAG: hypothetical protein P8075_17395 [Deltaproteobacteria bacterium]|jgi:hypothetical protein
MDESKIELIVQAVIAELKKRQNARAGEKATTPKGKGLFTYGDHRKLRSR